MYHVTDLEDENFQDSDENDDRRKTPDKGKLKATLPDIKTPEDSSKRL